MQRNDEAPSAPSAVAIEDPGKREFLKTFGTVGLGMGVGLGLPAAGIVNVASAALPPSQAQNGWQRRNRAFLKRMQAALGQQSSFQGGQQANGDENLPGHIASHTKGLPHNDLGEVDPGAYNRLLIAVNSGTSQDLAAVPMGTPGARLVQPRMGFNYSLIGQDAQGWRIPPPPRFASDEIAAEMVECYWGALTRDVPFVEYPSHPLIAQAASDLSMQPGYDGPRPGGSIDAQTLFRSALPGTLEGPWLSQFFWMPVQQGAYSTPQVLTPPLAGVDYSTSYADWLANMRGGGGGPTAAAGTPRWICTSRDLTRSLQLDVPLGFGYQHVMLALIHLLRLGIPRNPGLPIPPSNEADGLNGQLWELVARCTLAALTPVFWQKWQVHRRLRPEAYAGRVHNHINGAATYPIPTALLGSQALAATFSRYGTYLMPMAWKGGCPPHPSYPSAHAVIAAAGVTVLKAFFDGNAALPNPVLANADGTALVPYAGAPLTVEGELNKLAANIGISRVQTGIHFRSDSMQSIALGERMAINMLSELKPLRGGAFDNFTFRRFDGSLVTV